MDQQEMDKLVEEIQNFLNKNDKGTASDAPHATEVAEAKTADGSFIAPQSRQKLPLILKVNRLSSYVLEVLTIALVTTGVVHPFPSWPQTLMFLLGVLLFGIFSIVSLLGHQARIRLLLRIEENTRSIAASKARIAKALEQIQVE